MSWVKGSDTAGQHPIVTAPMAWDPVDGDVEREDLANLLFGLVYRCAAHSALYDTDYVISDGTVAVIAGRGWRERAAQAERAGYWTRVDRGYLLIDDSEHFLHIRLKAEKEWEKQRKRDNGNPALVIPVRLRDGDGCRHCGVVVNWAARNGGRAGTYDHIRPGQAARGPDDLVVSCKLCNSTRQADPNARPPLPAPSTPFYGAETVELLAKHGIAVPLSAARPRPQQAPAPAPPGDPAARGTPPQQPPRPRRQRDTAPAPPGDPASGGTTPPPARPARPADPAPATRQPGGHRAFRNTPATPPPAGHRALRDRASDPTPRTASDPAPGRTPPANTPDQDQQRLSADSGGNRQIAGVPDLAAPGRDRERDGHGSGGPALSPPPAHRNRRRRARRGRAHRPPAQENPP